MIVFNHLGIGMGAISLVAGYLIQEAMGQPFGDNSLAFLVTCGTAMAIDLFYRWCKNRLDGWPRFVHLSAGGMLSFLPLWLLAMIGFVYEAMQMLQPS